MEIINADEAVRTLKRMAKDCIFTGKLQEGEEYAIAASVLNRKGLFAHLTGKDVNEQFRKLEKERDELKEALGLMVYQYCVSGYDCPRLNHQYMTAGETAFRVLGLEQYDGVAGLEEWLFPECEPQKEEEDGEPRCTGKPVAEGE